MAGIFLFQTGIFYCFAKARISLAFCKTASVIEGGSAYRTNISSILKGKSGMPGEIIGTIDYSPQNYLGEIYANTNGGILGKITENKKEFFTGKRILFLFRWNNLCFFH